VAHRRIRPGGRFLLLGLRWLPALHHPGDRLVPRQDRRLQLLRGGVQHRLGGHTSFAHVKTGRLFPLLKMSQFRPAIRDFDACVSFSRSMVNCMTQNPTSRVALASCRNAFTMVSTYLQYRRRSSTETGISNSSHHAYAVVFACAGGESRFICDRFGSLWCCQGERLLGYCSAGAASTELCRYNPHECFFCY
jgi:hypothetical protein